MRGRAAGWYPDPLDPVRYARWWTGTAWLDDTAPPGGPALPRPDEVADTVARSQPVQDPAHPSVRQRRRALAYGAGIAVLALAGLWLAGRAIVDGASAEGAGSGAQRPVTPPGVTGQTAPVPAPLALAGLPVGANTSCTQLPAATAAPDAATGNWVCTWQTGPDKAGTVARGTVTCTSGGGANVCDVTVSGDRRVHRTRCATGMNGTLDCVPVRVTTPGSGPTR